MDWAQGGWLSGSAGQTGLLSRLCAVPFFLIPHAGLRVDVVLAGECRVVFEDEQRDLVAADGGAHGFPVFGLGGHLAGDEVDAELRQPQADLRECGHHSAW